MESYVTGAVIKTLREKKTLTQRQLADLLAVSDKTVSKWETGKGLPDITLLEPLARALSVSVAELLSGRCWENRNRAGNMLRGVFYVCPVCGNVIRASGQGAFNCCGIPLPPLEPELPDDEHGLTVEQIETDYYVTLRHPMTKEHYISFFAYVTPDRVQIRKMYPEQEAEARFPMQGQGELYAFCNRHGLYRCKTPPRAPITR